MYNTYIRTFCVASVASVIGIFFCRRRNFRSDKNFFFFFYAKKKGRFRGGGSRKRKTIKFREGFRLG